MFKISKMNANTKRSLTITAKIQTRLYLKNYEELFYDYDDLEEIIDNIFFFWLYNSTNKRYAWTSDTQSVSFLQKNSDYIRNLIRKTLKKELFKRNLLASIK